MRNGGKSYQGDITMKIYSCTTYFNEDDIFDIKYNSEKDWVDEIHIAEADYTFRKRYKGFNFRLPEEYDEDKCKVVYNKLYVKHKFVKNNLAGKLMLFPLRLKRDFYSKIVRNPSWHNEMYQHNAITDNIQPEDDDIIILSDIDEILNPDMKDELISACREHGIITVKLRFSMFYFNLFSLNWAGPADYSYRLFIMTGKYFKENKIRCDKLRKMGENHKLEDTVWCYPEFAGWHHSWLGDENFVMNKLNSYSHIKEHDGFNSIEAVQKSLERGVSLFPEHKLEKNNDVKLLPYIESNRDGRFKKYFL